MKPKSRAQAWTRERNMDKGRIASIRSLAKQLSTHKGILKHERDLLINIVFACNELLSMWK